MKKLSLILFCLINVVVIDAQDLTYFSKSFIEKGDKEYTKFAYQTAISYYLKAYRQDSSTKHIQEKIANSYRLLNDQASAEAWYEKVVKNETNQPDNYLYYAQALESNRKYEKAEVWYKKYEELEPNENRIGKKLAGLNEVHKYYSDSGYYEIVPVKINSKAPDFSATYYEKGIVFVSGRKKSPIVKKVFNWDQSSYLDLFYAEIDEKHHLLNPKQFNRRINTRYHEGPLAFYENETSVVFTRNNFHEGKEERSTDDINKLKLFFAKNNNGDWTDIEPFQYNDNEYSVGHPTITEDGKLLIFASDMPGSLGGTDLWYSELTGAGWTVPKNMGTKINTEGNEMFPFLDNETLYFASNGHAGLGGLDVYRTNFKSIEATGEISNLGSPLNSSKDDFGLITNDDGRSGYFSSNRIHELYDDLYHFNFDKPRITQINGLVELQRDLSPIESAKVFLIDSIANDTLEIVETDRKGRFSFDVPWDKRFSLVAQKEHYNTINVPMISTYSHHKEEAIILMKRMELIAKVIAIDNVTKELIPKPHIIVLDPVHGHSLTPANIEVDTFEYVIEPNITYDVAGAKKHYFTEHTDQFSGEEKYGEIFWIVPLGEIELDKAIALEKIYYDLNKANIRPDAAVELDKLVTILRENPDIKIELSSHTDSRGSDTHNKALSQRRAESAVAYIVKQGISSSRITAKGYGEEALVNNCTNGAPCSKEEHQRNRRTEFKVTAY
ncbi:OmpA family protein [Ekhidna sp.]